MSDELAVYALRDVQGLATGQPKDSGSWGCVYQVTVNGFPCIAKRLHDILVGQHVSAQERASVRRRFRNECVLLSRLRHPNVVQFIGVHYGRDQDDLTLVMEGLYMDLDRCLKHVNVRGVPLALPVKLAILLDVAYGLLYLHTQNPPIVHRDLTASNVLLTNDLRAKLADLGVSKILDLHPRSQATQTTCPGTLGAMPPEALIETPIYDAKLDVFSFGTVMLHVANQEFPIFYDVDRYERGKKHIAMRRRAISKMGETHVLRPLVLQCLQDDSRRRPPTAEVRADLERLAREHPKQFKDVIEMYAAMEEMRKVSIITLALYPGLFHTAFCMAAKKKCVGSPATFI